MLRHLREELLHIGDERRAAGAGQKALLRQLRRLCIRGHIRTQSCLHHSVKAQLLDPGDHLPDLCIGKLAGDRRCDHGVNLILLILVAFLQDLNGVQDKGFIHNGAEGALIHAGAAGDALVIVDLRRLILIHGDSAYLAASLAGANLLLNGAVRTDLCTASAGHALGVIDGGTAIHKRNRSSGTGILTPMGKTAPAGFADRNAVDGTLVAGNVDDLDDVGVIGIPTHSHVDPLA